MHYIGISLTTGYSFNSKFSIRSLTSQTERQLKSAGSFIPVFNFDYYIVDDKSSELENNPEKTNNIELSIGPGYTYTIVIKKKVYLSLGMSLSIGHLNTKNLTRLPDKTIRSKQNNVIFRGDTKLGIGYNGRKYYSGFYSSIASSQINYKSENTNASRTNSNLYFQLFFGMRFNSPDYIKRFVTKIKNKI